MPPKKKQRVVKNADSTTSSTGLPSALEQLDAVVGNMLSHVQDAGATTTAALDVEKMKQGFLSLKGIQNELFVRLQRTEAAAKERRAAREKRQSQLDGLRYEESHLQAEMQKCQNFKTPYLDKIVADEQGESVNDFLKTDVMDPNKKQQIVGKLQMEINARGTLERDLKAKQKELASLQEQVKKRKAFLQSLPNHLASIERASIPLQKAMYNSDSKTKGLRMNGTSRRLRLDAAQSLPLPLFTLFSSLQNYIDQAVCQEDSLALSLAVTTAGEKQQVLVHVPVADGTTQGRPKKVTIHFQYLEDANTITATVSGGNMTLFQENVLDCLFPDQPATKDDGAANTYSWCNYLAGLHRVERNVQQNSVRAIVRVLCRRLRANASLKTMLTSLQQRSQIPLLPEAAAADGTNLEHTCKLSKFVSNPEKTESGVDDSSFTVILRKGSDQMHVQVELHKTRYPEVPPKWKLNIAQDGKPLLYDERLAELEHKVNVETLESMKEASDVANEWILIHQLHRIMETWDSW